MGLMQKYGTSAAGGSVTPGTNLDNVFVSTAPTTDSATLTELVAASITTTQPYTKLMIWLACNLVITEVTPGGVHQAQFSLNVDGNFIRQGQVNSPNATAGGPNVFFGFTEVYNTGSPSGGSFNIQVNWGVADDLLDLAQASFASLLVIAVEGPVP